VYDSVILADRPVAYWPLSGVNGDTSLVGGYQLARHGKLTATTWVDGTTPALAFDGKTGYLEVPSDLAFSVTNTGALTVEAWLRPDVLAFPATEGSGYVHWLQKQRYAQQNECEWACRIYSQGNSEDRGNRVSGYCFNLPGGRGAGSYFQDALTAKQWIHYMLVINTTPSGKYPTGYTKIYRDGVLRDQDALAGYGITPQPGTAPLRIGGSGESYFAGAIAKVAIYGRELPAERITAHYTAT
jgi:hypothetical protein